MSTTLGGTVGVVTGASSGIGESTARALAAQGARVAGVARREDRLDALVEVIEGKGGTALAVPTDVTDRAQADAAEWERKIAVNQEGLLSMTHAPLPHLLTAGEDELRGVPDIAERLLPEDIADSIAYMVIRPRRASVSELWNVPTSQA